MIPLEISVWACPTCGYWREEKRTGIHTAVNPEDPRGRMVAHPLVKTTFWKAPPDVSGAKFGEGGPE